MADEYMGLDDNITMITETRLPVCLCLDTSGSMKKDDGIDQLNIGVNALLDYVRNNEKTANSVELAIVTFDSEIKVIRDFDLVDENCSVKLTAQGGTGLAHGIMQSLDILEARKDVYKKAGREYYQPILIVFTDGKPGDMEDVPAAQARCQDLISKKKLVCIAASVGNDEDSAKNASIESVLKGFTNRVIHIKNARYEEFFEWVGKSMEVISDSKPGDEVNLPKPESDFFTINS